LTNSRFASEYEHKTPSFGFQFGYEVRCAWTATAAETAVSMVRLEIATARQ
jgi:hypothetical protein